LYLSVLRSVGERRVGVDRSEKTYVCLSANQRIKNCKVIKFNAKLPMRYRQDSRFTARQQEHTNVQNQEALYNSRIIRIYLNYLRKYCPDVDIDYILKESAIAKYEIEDSAHWFTQNQVDRFHEMVVFKTGDRNIARKAGRFAASSDGLGAAKQYTLGLMSPTAMYLLMKKLYPLLSRGAKISSKKLGSEKVEIVAVPKPGIEEKPYQCQNRIGSFESIAKWFTANYASVDHPSCIHTGDECCRYIISWEKTTSHRWKKIRNYSIILSFLIYTPLFFFIPIKNWIVSVLTGMCLITALAYNTERLSRKALTQMIDTLRVAAKDNLKEGNVRYNNALLVQEIGQAASKIFDIDRLVKTVAGIMAKRLDFDRGMILLANKEQNLLRYSAGYGFSNVQEEHLREIELELDPLESKDLFFLAMREGKPFLVNDVDKMADSLSPKSSEFINGWESQSLICAPILYEKETLGVLLAGNSDFKAPLKQSDLNLILGISSHLAISIIHASSFKKIKQSEERYRLLADNVTDVIWIIDLPHLQFSYVSPSVERMQGYTPQELRKLSLQEYLTPPSFEVATRKISEELTIEAAGTADPFRSSTIELEVIRKDGTTLWIEVTASFLRDKKGSAIGILGVSRDISERRQAANETKKLGRQLQQAQKMEAIGTLAGGVAHDFNNILSAIMGYTELSMMDVPDGSQIMHNLDEIYKASNRARDLILQILAFSRQSELEQKPIDVRPIVKEALKMLRASLPTTIEIRQSIDGESAIVEADPTQIHQILMNLCTNAAHAMNEKGGILEVRLTEVSIDQKDAAIQPHLQPGPFLKLSVTDTGRGMSPKLIDRIFDPYFTTKEKGDGTGLGLAVVQGIARTYGGAVTVESELDKGSVFHVFLPKVQKELSLHARPTQFLPTGHERILFVDDEKPLVEIGKQMLERLGYNTVTRTSSIEALKLFQADPHRYDLVITDMTMPNMTGDSLAKELIKIRSDIPIILCSGYSQRLTEQRVEEFGIKSFVMKPLVIKDLANTIRKVLDEKE
jgi:PAS domain S-box-containing protein